MPLLLQSQDMAVYTIDLTRPRFGVSVVSAIGTGAAT
jgi:hypothetical protein